MKKALIAYFIVLILSVIAITMVLRSMPAQTPDTVAINNIVMTAVQNHDQTEVASVITVQLKDELDNMSAAARDRELTLRILVYVYVAVVAAVGLVLYLYCEKNVLAPFRRLRQFAKDVAAGNLDIPLEMDKSGSFGAFTESFDLMREELKRARENERAADRSKKELVASLSHDIKTPIASIKATVELMQVSVKSEKEQTQLKQIETKAEQINTLITDMFHATLHELEKLSVTPAEIHSTVLSDMIASADYKERVGLYEIPDCIIIADSVRLQQIFDNIFGNSYKYADTEIAVNANIDGDYLGIEVVDFGEGVPEEDLPLLTNKFYRGQNAADKGGYGLGLYINSYLISQMSGELECGNGRGSEDGENGKGKGFSVKLRLRLAGKN